MFAGYGVLKPKCLGVQGVSWHNLKAILYKLFVFGVESALADAVSAIAVVVKERVPYVIHMYPYLMGAPCLQLALHQCYIAKPLKHSVVGNSVLSAAILHNSVS